MLSETDIAKLVGCTKNKEDVSATGNVDVHEGKVGEPPSGRSVCLETSKPEFSRPFPTHCASPTSGLNPGKAITTPQIVGITNKKKVGTLARNFARQCPPTFARELASMLRYGIFTKNLVWFFQALDILCFAVAYFQGCDSLPNVLFMSLAIDFASWGLRGRSRLPWPPLIPASCEAQTLKMAIPPFDRKSVRPESHCHSTRPPKTPKVPLNSSAGPSTVEPTPIPTIPPTETRTSAPTLALTPITTSKPCDGLWPSKPETNSCLSGCTVNVNSLTQPLSQGEKQPGTLAAKYRYWFDSVKHLIVASRNETIAQKLNTVLELMVTKEELLTFGVMQTVQTCACLGCETIASLKLFSMIKLSLSCTGTSASLKGLIEDWFIPCERQHAGCACRTEITTSKVLRCPPILVILLDRFNTDLTVNVRYEESFEFNKHSYVLFAVIHVNGDACVPIDDAWYDVSNAEELDRNIEYFGEECFVLCYVLKEKAKYVRGENG